jgi:hypothetical protein
MKIEHTSHIKKNNYFSNITPKDRFNENLELSLSLRGESIPRNFERGFIDFHYQLMNHKIEIKRIFVNQEDLGNPFKLKINTGDLLLKIRIGLYFKRKVSNQYLDTSLMDFEVPDTSNFINISLLKHLISLGEKVEFLEKIRLMGPENFQHLIDTDLTNLEALIDKVSDRVFYLWAISDKIVKMSSTSKIPLSYLDGAVESYFNEYYDGKVSLGLTLQNS